MISTLSQLIATAESNNRQYAMRFEPGFNSTPDTLALHNCMTANVCTYATAKIICSSSWGLFQIMGDELYRRGLIDCAIGEYMADPTKQYDVFGKFIAEKGIAYNLGDIVNDAVKREHFAALYNGNGPVYGAYLMRIYNGAK